MSATAGPLVNGSLPPPFQSVNEAHEYEKILKLRDEVFAGSHPRLTVPAHALKIVPPRPPQLISQPQFNASAFLSNSIPANHQLAQPLPTNSLPVSSSQPAANPVSEINPILLTKSDDLVRAETQLKRQRLEKALRDQFEQKRLEARKRPAPAEAKPDFDIPAILARALEVAKPASFKDDASASDSFDENSFYSSRAPDSTPERGVPSPSPPQHQMPVHADDFDADGPSGRRVQSAVMGSPLNAEHEYDDSPRMPPSGPRNRTAGTAVDLTAMDLDDDEEEGEYSPPEAMEQYATPNEASSQALQNSRDPRSRPLRRYSELDDEGRRPASPSDANMRINGRMRRERGRQQQAASPEPGQQYGPRKRRKMDKKERKAQGRRNGGLSPDAFIKEENVSPPPFHEVQPLGSGRLRPIAADRPIVIDDGPTQDMRYVPVGDRYMDSPARPVSRHVEPMMPLSEPRVTSRATMRPVRDDQDLRRVASMHNMRSEQPREYLEPVYDTPTRARASYRAASPIVIEQPRSLHEEFDRAPLQEVRVSRTPAPVYRDVYQDVEPELRYQSAMPPPPIERIVVDQYGRRFREILQPERSAIAPRAMSVRPSDMEPSQYEAYRGSRGTSVFVEPPAERRYAPAMPPPATYRQVAETPRASAVQLDPATREHYEQGVAGSASAQVMDRPSRQPVYVDERTEFREPMRMSSVRPSGMRYEDAQPRETIARGPSVRPLGRGGSVFLDDGAQPRREYIPVEQPRYRVVEPEERFFDAQGREVIPVDGARDGRTRVVQRY